MKRKQDERHLARKLALATLFCSSENNNQQDCFKVSLENLELEKGEWDEDLAKDIMDGTIEHQNEIDKKIEDYAPQWPIEKIFKIDLIILRMALYELIYKENTPNKVVVDEAIELAKEFGNETSGKFINGVLGTFIEEESAEEE